MKNGEVLVKKGTSTKSLNNGIAGYYTDPVKSALPQDKKGNFSLAAHRDGHGAKFHNIDKLKKGDAIVFETKDNWYVYKVYATLPETSKFNVKVLAPVPKESGRTEGRPLHHADDLHARLHVPLPVRRVGRAGARGEGERRADPAGGAALSVTGVLRGPQSSSMTEARSRNFPLRLRASVVRCPAQCLETHSGAPGLQLVAVHGDDSAQIGDGLCFQAEVAGGDEQGDIHGGDGSCGSGELLHVGTGNGATGTVLALDGDRTAVGCACRDVDAAIGPGLPYDDLRAAVTTEQVRDMVLRTPALSSP